MFGRTRGMAALLAAIVGPVCLLGAGGCLRTPPAAAPRPTHVAVTDGFAGDQACSGCHDVEFRQHRGGRHSTTLRPLNSRILGPSAPPIGRIPNSEIVLVDRNGAYGLTEPGNDAEPAPLQLVFGSGKTGMTFAAVLPGGEMIEISRSYFPSRKLWYVTPGHESRPSAEPGLRCTPDEAGKCLRCHGVPAGNATVALERRTTGIGCEVCHGPSRAHADAMRAGRKDAPRPARLSALGGRDSVRVCSACHRGKEAVKAGTEQERMTNRFQAFGLMQSRCFLESNDKLSCVTCHNPHTDVSTVGPGYDRICLGCHGGAPATAHTADGRRCPVNPTGKCVGCHMPSRPVFRRSTVPVRMAEHLIKVYRSLPRP